MIKLQGLGVYGGPLQSLPLGHVRALHYSGGSDGPCATIVGLCGVLQTTHLSHPTWTSR